MRRTEKMVLVVGISAWLFLSLGSVAVFDWPKPFASSASVAMAQPPPQHGIPEPLPSDCDYQTLTQWNIGQVVMYRDPVDSDLCRFAQVLGENDPDTGEPVVRYLEDLFTLKSDQVLSVFKAGTGQDLIDFIYGYGPSDYPLPVRLRVNPER